MSKDIVLILGASSDLGKELIRGFKDCTVIAHYRSRREQIESLKTDQSVTLIPIQANLTQESEVKSFISALISKELYPTKILHFAATKLAHTRFKQLNWDALEQDFNLQVRSITLVLQAFLPKMVEKKQGKILFCLSSVTQNAPPKLLSAYVTVKYALLGLMKALAVEYADKNIQINAISPSMIETTFLSEITEKYIEMNAELHPLKRNATVADIVPLIHFLLSPAAGFLNGVNVGITGGAIIS